MFWVYLLRCADNSYYTGHTDNLELRISQHHAGECAGYTFTRRPVELAWSQEFVTRQEALAAERAPLKIQQRRDTALLTKNFSLHITNMLRPNFLFAPCLA